MRYKIDKERVWKIYALHSCLTRHRVFNIVPSHVTVNYYATAFLFVFAPSFIFASILMLTEAKINAFPL